MNPRQLFAILLLAGLTWTARAQMTSCDPLFDPTVSYPSNALTYPMPSDQYSVEYSWGNGNKTNATVYISEYGQTVASPFNTNSGYIQGTSMSFVSIPVPAGTNIELFVTRLSSNFQAADNVSIRPHTKAVTVTLRNGGSVSLTTTTGPDFAGDQFLLWWGSGTNSSSVEGLVFFLDPVYAPPTSPHAKTILTNTDLTNLNRTDTLIFQGTVLLEGTGDQVYSVPNNITNIYLAPGAWVKGKLEFQNGNGLAKQIYGPGVLDGSLFRYDERTCSGDPGAHALAFDTPNSAMPDTFRIDGIIISDQNHAADDLVVNGSMNNVKTIAWNGLNGGFRIGDNTTVSNVFLRCGDDSLMMWGTNATVKNATVWQNYNGGVVNLGWGATSAGDYCLIDGLYVVKTDWLNPNQVSFTDTHLDGQNDGVIVSLMAPGTRFGTVQTPVFRNILIEDPPRVLLSLKIVFPECNDTNSPRDDTCTPVDLTLPSKLNLNIENLCSPASILSNSIGFLTTSSNFMYEFPAGTNNTFTNPYTFTGCINIGLTNVLLQLTNGSIVPLMGANALATGNIMTSGTNVNVTAGFNPGPCLACLPPLNISTVGTNNILSWPTNFPNFYLEMVTKLGSPPNWKTNLITPVVIGGMNVVTNPVANKMQFYRLSE